MSKTIYSITVEDVQNIANADVTENNVGGDD
jgi:hypothetical protein